MFHCCRGWAHIGLGLGLLSQGKKIGVRVGVGFIAMYRISVRVRVMVLGLRY